MTQEPETLGAYLAWEMKRRRWNPNAIEAQGGPSRQYIAKILDDNRAPEERAEAEVDWPGPHVLRRLVDVLVMGDSDPTARRRVYMRLMELAGFVTPERDQNEAVERRVSEDAERMLRTMQEARKAVEEAERKLREITDPGDQ